jgi:hypothetical protein
MHHGKLEKYMSKHIIEVIQDPDDPEGLVIPFTDEILAEVGWKSGDVLIWKDNGDQSVTLTKKDGD